MTRYNYLIWIRLLCPILLIDSLVLAAMAADAVSFVPLPLNSPMPITHTLAEIENTYNVERLHTFDQKQKAKMLNPASSGPFSHQRKSVSEKDNVFDRYSPPSIPYDREVTHKARQDFFNTATDDAFVSPDQADQKYIPNEFPSKRANSQTFNSVLAPASMPDQVPLGMHAAEYPDRPYHDSVAGRERRALSNSLEFKPSPSQSPAKGTIRYFLPSYYKYQRAIFDYLVDFEESKFISPAFLPDFKSFDGDPNRMLAQYWGIERDALEKHSPSLDELLPYIVYSPYVHKNLANSVKLAQNYKDLINYFQLDIQSTSKRMIAFINDPTNPAKTIDLPMYQRILSRDVRNLRTYIARHQKDRRHGIWTIRCAARCNTQLHHPNHIISLEELFKSFGKRHINYFYTNEATRLFLKEVSQNQHMLTALQYAVHNAQLYMDYLADHKLLPEPLVAPAYGFISSLDKYHENIGILYEYAKSHASQPHFTDKEILNLRSLTDKLFVEGCYSIYTQFHLFTAIADARYTTNTQSILDHLARVPPAQVDTVLSPVIAEATQVVEELTDTHSYLKKVQANYAKSQDRLRNAIYGLSEARVTILYNMIPNPKPIPDTPSKSRSPNPAQSRHNRSINSPAPNTNTDTNTNTNTDTNTNTSTDAKNDTPTASNSNPDTHTNSNQQ
ncbi:hypothetical protein NEHOM01_0699 [Nematocida homosporus]|uniref:uncharacterized protein n=1 Tax=Nematocida homosporus TaxID=1912981 RepID=UPI00221F1564|nr:uncharacterized protein NEHOM01_0699 [Nematocida homosporus]KAI5185241.1 hypothetical protein NEHOM01_0699 [Nematocida homosporus]